MRDNGVERDTKRQRQGLIAANFIMAGTVSMPSTLEI